MRQYGTEDCSDNKRVEKESNETKTTFNNEVANRFTTIILHWAA